MERLVHPNRHAAVADSRLPHVFGEPGDVAARSGCRAANSNAPGISALPTRVGGFGELSSGGRDFQADGACLAAAQVAPDDDERTHQPVLLLEQLADPAG